MQLTELHCEKYIRSSSVNLVVPYRIVIILDILLEDEGVAVYDGEKVSKDTQRIHILNRDEDNGRKTDLLIETKYGDVLIELCSIEFKYIEQYQQAIESYLTWIWSGREDYLVTFIYQKNLMELNDFRSTLQCLCFWRDSVVKLSNEIRLAACKEKRKYIVSDISAPSRSFNSPPRSSVQGYRMIWLNLATHYLFSTKKMSVAYSTFFLTFTVIFNGFDNLKLKSK
ncbi:hypothetical protein BD560DRAFT_492502 [Blakeslea trispora]|nr:hypothetical protein BD560DRAFT_492502 [Blakeslea trispora]